MPCREMSVWLASRSVPIGSSVVESYTSPAVAHSGVSLAVGPNR
jgi:hypothetical protein